MSDAKFNPEQIFKQVERFFAPSNKLQLLTGNIAYTSNKCSKFNYIDIPMARCWTKKQYKDYYLISGENSVNFLEDIKRINMLLLQVPFLIDIISSCIIPHEKIIFTPRFNGINWVCSAMYPQKVRQGKHPVSLKIDFYTSSDKRYLAIKDSIQGNIYYLNNGDISLVTLTRWLDGLCYHIRIVGNAESLKLKSIESTSHANRRVILYVNNK